MSPFLLIGIVCVLASFLPHLNQRRFRTIRVLGGLFVGVGGLSWLTAPLPPMGRTFVELLYAMAALAFVLLGRFAVDMIWVRDLWIVGVLLWAVHLYRVQAYRG